MRSAFKSTAAAVALAALLVTQSGCIGPFKLTKSLLAWNKSVSNKHVNELIFVGLNFVPVYWFALMGDAFVFNSIEFWGGTNPISSHGEGFGDVALRVIERGDLRIEVEGSQVEAGRALQMRGYEKGELIHEARLLAPGDGRVLKLDRDGDVLATAVLRPDGSAWIHDAASGELREFEAGSAH